MIEKRYTECNLGDHKVGKTGPRRIMQRNIQGKLSKIGNGLGIPEEKDN